MRHETGSGGQPGVLTPSVPRDIGVRTQRRRVLEAMALSCAEKSFAATTIADVVGKASISRATFYKHFANKRECFEAAVQGFVAELLEAAIVAQSDAESQAEAIRKATSAVLELLAMKPAYANLIVIEAPILNPRIISSNRDAAMAGLRGRLGMVSQGDEHARADSLLSFGRAHVLAASYVTAGKTKQLLELLPETVYILLLPLVGHKEALAQVTLV